MQENIKHKWYDVIVAWANGEKIQYMNRLTKGEWRNYTLHSGLVPDFNGPGNKWRIKPKTVTKKYRMALVDMYAGIIVKEPYVKAVDITSTNDYIEGFIRWIGDIAEVEIESD